MTALTPFQSLALASLLTAGCAAFAVKVLRIRGSLGMAASGSILSAGAYLAGMIFPSVGEHATHLWASLEFSEAVFHGMLCFLLFAGAMHLDLPALSKWRWHVLALATVGVALSTGIFAGVLWALSRLLGVEIPLPWLLVFGALISPTDPIAVVSLLKKLGAPQDLEIKIAAESLFNDGTAVVLFATFLAMAVGGTEFSAAGFAWEFAREAGGGAVVGLVGAGIGLVLLKSINDPPVEISITLALALCIYAGAEALHASAPLAVALCGVVVGNAKHRSMTPETLAKLMPFWETLDEILTMALFAMVGLALMGTNLGPSSLWMGMAAICAGLLARFLSVWLAVYMFPAARRPLLPGTVATMTWGGLRGGLSIAMALALPASPWRDMIVSCCWFVVMFSLLAQAPTMPWVLRKHGLTGEAPSER
jgi:CPA1 family monovalent cation:H+ antiporter